MMAQNRFGNHGWDPPAYQQARAEFAVMETIGFLLSLRPGTSGFARSPEQLRVASALRGRENDFARVVQQPRGKRQALGFLQFAGDGTRGNGGHGAMPPQGLHINDIL